MINMRLAKKVLRLRRLLPLALTVFSLPSAIIPFADATCVSRPKLQLHSGYSAHGTSHLTPSVKVLQTQLNTRYLKADPLLEVLTVDGFYGPKTEEAVKAWQQHVGQNTIDGIVGPHTWGSLCPCTIDNKQQSSPASTSTTGWTPRAQFVVNSIFSCLSPSDTYVCNGATRPGQPSSDHSTGNAVDCFPGSAGIKAQGMDKTEGDQLADWVRENADSLNVHYVIWYRAIWNIERDDEGWRPCAGPSATCYSGTNPTSAHYDHVHISVY